MIETLCVGLVFAALCVLPVAVEVVKAIVCLTWAVVRTPFESASEEAKDRAEWDRYTSTK